ncbi:MAG: lysophospholipase L1-like esterase [Bradymonadia bacterium]|jgi:lysophospholipase L1-like esterase
MMRRWNLGVLALSAGLAAGCGSDTAGYVFAPVSDVTSDVDAGVDGGVALDASITDGGASDTDSPDAAGACDEAARDDGIALLVEIYTDNDESDRSVFDDAETDGDVPVVASTLSLWDGTTLRSTATCDDGIAAFGGLSEGVYMRDWPIEDSEYCRTRNCPRGIVAALQSGSLKIVTAGDSVPVIGADVTFPDRLATLMAPLGNIESVNVAVPGTVSEDWVPGTDLFRDNIEANLADADVFIVSLGGNDILNYANNAFSGGGDIQEAIAGVPTFVREVQDRILFIKDQVRFVNPDIDVVYLLYPNYAESSTWQEQFGFALPIIRPLILDALEQILDELAVEEDLIIADMYGAMEARGDDLGLYLDDPLHFNSAGQDILTEVIFEAMGGVRVGGAGEIGLDQRIGLQP